MYSLFFLSLLLLAGLSAPEQRQDMLLADFEGETYGDWRAEGTAFGTGPARGTLPDQMPVTGFRGRGLVNTYLGGDSSTGMLSSPPFRIQRRYINFLIGGGKYPGQTCINLVVEGQIVRTATGPNDRPGGSEMLAPACWDVSELEGKTAVLQIVDMATDGWGHINIDHIVQSDRKVPMMTEKSREKVLEQDFLLIPVKTGAPKSILRLRAGDRMLCECEVELAPDAPDFHAPLDVRAWKGQRVTLWIEKLREDSTALERVKQSGTPDYPETLYREKLRPQFHFTAPIGWLNDPNGLVYYRGEYHLFFQHNPYGVNWGNMHWGHAVSRDLTRWQVRPNALAPDSLGTIFSGSGVVDRGNTTGFQSGKEPPIVLIYTAAGGSSPASAGQPFTQCLAYSADGGRTWTKYDNNPVLKHVAAENRDPKVVWHAPTRRWIMALYLNGNEFGFYASPDLKSWTLLHTITVPDCAECPDFFEMPVKGDPKTRKWVWTAANGRYLIGSFDGQRFTPETGTLQADFGANFYAVQTYSDLPASDGRRIQLAWMAGGNYPQMPFNQQMSFPCELTLRPTPEGLRLFRLPAREIRGLYERERVWSDLSLKPGENPLSGLTGELWDIETEIEIGEAAEVGLRVRGEAIRYSVREKTLSSLGRNAPLEPIQGRIRLRALADRASLEVFGNDGRVSLTSCFLPREEERGLEIYAVGGTARIVRLQARSLRSAVPQTAR
jgi:sucrose-6-phosphate hydrolase SacC (GH32 family)